MEFKLKGEYIKLGQLLKAVGIISNGSEAKEILLKEEIYVNNEIENKRGKKLKIGDIIKYKNKEIKII